jgi:hypothetical protein
MCFLINPYNFGQLNIIISTSLDIPFIASYRINATSDGSIPIAA